MKRRPDCRPVITLTTDFGLSDEYAGTVKGVILSTCRDTAIVDLTHDIKPQDIAAAAMTIGASFRYFPEGSVHMVVVDPGVGSDRRILAVRAENHLFIAPDNGVLTPVLTEGIFQDAFHITNQDLFQKTISRTFHGRDIMAPVAAKLACGLDISLVGPQLGRRQCCRIPLPEARYANGNIIGEIIHIDHFGNMRTSITIEDLVEIPTGTKRGVSIGSHSINCISTTYADAGPGTLLALFDSRNHLELAVNGGNAARTLGCQVGDEVIVSWTAG
jgi:S-adenosyl-L-methionine hydrolase (adenosine-forming)